MADKILPLKVPVISLTQEEIDEYRELIEEGKLPRDWFEQYERAVEQNVFGHDVKHDRHGNPIEQGFGSAAHPTRNSINAYKAHQMGNKIGPEPNFAENLAKMEADLAAFEGARKLKRDAARAKRKVA